MVSKQFYAESNRLNAYATSNDQIVAGLERSSAAMNAANNSLEETIALFTAGQEITQDAEKMGVCPAA